MARVLVLLLVLVILAIVARKVWVAILQLRVGAVPEGVDVPEVPLVPDRGWQVTRTVTRDVATVQVAHPSEGVARTWTVALRDPGTRRTLEESMQRAGALAQQLSRRE